MPDAPFFSRRQRFHSVGSTNDVVRDWLAGGAAEVALAVADEQTAGRGREGRTWTAPRGTALLASAGFRPTWISPERAWRIPATVSLAMADAAEDAAGLTDRAIRLKWPNDLVLEDGDGTVRKLAGVLGESEGLGSGDPRVVVGIGVNANWAADDFPAELASSMTSLRVASGDRPIDLTALLDAFTMRLEARIEELRAGTFDVAAFVARQLTDGRTVRLELPDGTSQEMRALAVDSETGALAVEDARAPGGRRAVFSGEIRHVRLAEGPVRTPSGV